MNDGNLTYPSSENFAKCQFKPFPFVYGGNAAGDMFLYDFEVIPTDNNIIHAGSSTNISLGWGQDAYIMRVTTTGLIHWYNHLMISSGVSERIKSLTYSATRSAVYTVWHTSAATYKYAIVKLTYGEGKMEWSKYVPLITNSATGVVSFLQNLNLQIVPGSTAVDMVMGNTYIWTTIAIKIYTHLTDNGSNLVVNY